MSNNVRKHQFILVFFGLLLTSLGLYGLGFSLSPLDPTFWPTIFIVFILMLGGGIVLYIKALKLGRKMKPKSK